MKKLFFYSLSLFLIIGIYSCKHKDKTDTPVDTPTVANQVQSKVLPKEEIEQKSTNTTVTTKETIQKVVEAGTKSNDPVVQSKVAEWTLTDWLNVAWEALQEIAKDTTETGHPDYLRVKMDDGTYRIYSKTTDEFIPEAYALFDDFVQDEGVYVTRALTTEGRFLVLDGNLNTIFSNVEEQDAGDDDPFLTEPVALISSFSPTTASCSDVNEDTGANFTKPAYYMAKVEFSTGAIRLLDIKGKLTRFYYAEIPNASTQNHIILYQSGKGIEDRVCEIGEYYFLDGATQKEYKNTVKSSKPYCAPSLKISLTNISGNTESKEGKTASCYGISQWINNADMISLLELSRKGLKESIKINYYQ